jgi:E3 ubiquitin-protein ligase RNF115/126
MPGILQALLGGGRVFRAGADENLQQILAHIMENDPNRYGPPPAAKSAIEKLKKVPLADCIAANLECSVCLTRMSESDEGAEVYEMPCEHLFHKECLLPWLKEHNSCPTCRHELPTDDADYERQRREAANQGDGSLRDTGVGPDGQ